MRGDSIRDLYAKTLALLGLGVLAGTGALVDYWPSGVRLPVVESGLRQPELSLALQVPETAFEAAVRVAPSRPMARPLLEAPAISLAAFSHELRPLAVPEAMIDDDPPSGSSASHAAVVLPVTYATANTLAPLGEEVSLSVPPVPWAESTLAMSSAPVSLSAAVDDSGMFSDMMRATKSSLVTTGRKTGASIVGAFRVVSGAVKKAIPN